MTKRKRTGGDLDKVWFDRTGSQVFFWGNVCGHRPDCWHSLRADVLPLWKRECEAGVTMLHSVLTSSAEATDEVSGECCEFALGTIPIHEESKWSYIAALRAWLEKWNLPAWLEGWVEVTLESLDNGGDPPWPANGQRLLPPDADLVENTRAVSNYRERSPQELRFEFTEWALLPYGETIPQARLRIQNAFTAALAEYLVRAEELLSRNMAPFLPEHFAWLVRRLVPPVERCQDIAASPYAKTPFPDPMPNQVGRSQVSRQTCALAKFLGGLPKFQRPGPVVKMPRSPRSSE